MLYVYIKLNYSVIQKERLTLDKARNANKIFSFKHGKRKYLFRWSV